VVETFTRFGLRLPAFRDVLAGTAEAIETAAEDVANTLHVQLVKRYRAARGGWHFTNVRFNEPYAETVYVQHNRNYEEAAEPDFKVWPVLIYVLTTTRSDQRIAELVWTDATALRVMDVAVPVRQRQT
jgi:hypothetical protein